MKRRGFLQMLGGALAAPLMPSASLGAARKAAYTPAALHAAIYHAQNRFSVSVFGLAQVLGIKIEQAEVLISDMSARGIVGPVQGTRSGGWASSNVMQRKLGEASAARKIAQNRQPRLAQSDPTAGPTARQWAEPDIRPLLRKLHGLATARGYALHPRCAEMVA